MDGRKKRDSGVDIAIAQLPNVVPLDPCEQRIAALAINPDDVWYFIGRATLEQTQRAHLGGQPIALVIDPRRVLLERVGPLAGADAVDPTVAATGDPVEFDRRADKGRRNR